MADIDKVETWRLSRIEDELEKLDFTQGFLDQSFSDSIFNSLPSEIGQSLKLTAAKTDVDQKEDEGYSEENDNLPPPPNDLESDFPPPPQELLYPHYDSTAHSELTDPGPELSQLTRVCVQDSSETGIYSEANVKPVIKDQSEAEAAKKISDKYDSLKRLTLPSLPKFIPPGYVQTKPISVVEGESGPGMLHKVPSSPVRMTDPFLDCIQTPSSPPKLPPQASISHPPSPSATITHSASWSHMQPNTQTSLPSQGQPTEKLSNHSIKRMSFASSLSETEILQVEMFYRSHKSEVFVCSCVADLLLGSASEVSNSSSSSDGKSGPWTMVTSGVPVIVLENEDRHGNKKLSLVVAEKGTGFCLWKQSFTHLTAYQAKEPNLHTLHLDSDHTKLAGLRFQDTSGASHFHQRLQGILSNPDISLVNINAKSKKGKTSKSADKKASKLKRRPTSKGDISAPCCFTHITSLDRSEGMGVLEMTGTNRENSDTNGSVLHSRQKIK